ncbi:DUF1145 domain-containing protein [Pseudomonas sp. CNPSo 3701]|uniref:DUF1145 domain-containing protein n=1 Tax=Pseudomonas sp. CNPSo 3701 TaxID=3027943 RepID=UPI0023649737|nr:DUF1145 domain-containing protein [Pseudomonas sp. CNPSo 3701]MDD1507234.1 DUF1145 domain-containing protein [Pseudomonas sp. CNPSo 3701]
MDTVFGLTLYFPARKRSNVPHITSGVGRAMKTITRLGKLLATLFWCVVLANLISPFAQPFAQLLNVAGMAMLGLHLAELALFKAELVTQPQLIIERAKVLAFGIFHIWSLPSAVAEVKAEPESAPETMATPASASVEEAVPCAN